MANGTKIERENQKENLSELNLAIELGQRVLECLRGAKEQLKIIQNQGVFEKIGIGIFQLHSKKIKEANKTIQKAKELLIGFRRALRYLEVPQQLKVEIEGFVTFADFFFDSLLADWYVQSRLRKSYEEVEDAMRQIEDILEKLQTMKEKE